jgi:hypothetical protein
MHSKFKRRFIVFAAVALVAVGSGAAFAATQLGSPRQESQAIVNDAAQQLGIEPSRLSDALKKALQNRVDAAVAAGRMTKAEGDALKARIASEELPIFLGGGHRIGFGHGADLGAATSYLGLTEAELRTQLAAGKSLAQIAGDRGKSVDGLIQAFVDAATKELEAAVAAGRLTEAQKQLILGDLKARITEHVNGTMPAFHRGPGIGATPPVLAAPTT